MPKPDQTEVLQRRALVRRAHAKARKANAAPPAILDKWLADTWLATEDAPARAAAIMLERTETLFALLTDRTRWLRPHEGTIRGVRSS